MNSPEKIHEGFFSKKVIIWVCFLLLLALFLLFSNYGILKRISVNNRQKELHVLIENQKVAIDSLSNEIKILMADSLEIERLARESYGMVKPGEKVFYIQKAKD